MAELQEYSIQNQGLNGYVLMHEVFVVFLKLLVSHAQPEAASSKPRKWRPLIAPLIAPFTGELEGLGADALSCDRQGSGTVLLADKICRFIFKVPVH